MKAQLSLSFPLMGKVAAKRADRVRPDRADFKPRLAARTHSTIAPQWSPSPIKGEDERSTI